MVRLLGRGWRDDLGGLVAAASRDVLVAAPYIKSAEAAWLCDQLRPGVNVLTLANIDANSLRTSSLDLAALRRLAGVSPASRVVSLSHLHAKVFVADEVGAIVTSGNLTRSGLDRNLEYGVLFDEPALIGTVRRDMLLQVRLQGGMSMRVGSPNSPRLKRNYARSTRTLKRAPSPALSVDSMR